MPVENASGLLLVHTSPLLEEEGNAGRPALSPNVYNPFSLHRAGLTVTVPR
jgi:hypothetical protein